MERKIIMKTILCYGDSNTYGYNPHNNGRYVKELRWTTILAKLLGEDYDVIAEGLNGRTTAYNREGEDVKNGLVHYRTIYGSHRPVDIIIFMLGTNDCNEDVDISVDKIVEGMEKLIVIAKEIAIEIQGYLPKIILIVPPIIGSDYQKSVNYRLDNDSSIKSKQLAKPYELLADMHECIFLDASNLKVGDEDFKHLVEESHVKLANMLYEIIVNIND